LVSVFVDTSALYALLDSDDAGHERALRGSEHILGEELLTHSYVLVETVSLVRRRLGAEAAARLLDEVLPAIKIVDVDTALRGRTLAAFRAALSSGVSLVDRTSFEFMRTLGISRAYALDADFESEGFELVS
jgi:predicted nucleic acid-binding protein